MELLRDGHEKIIAPMLIHAEVSHALSKYIKGGYIDWLKLLLPADKHRKSLIYS